MYKAKFQIKHKGCWTPPLSERYPEVSFLVPNSTRLADGSVGDMFYFSGPSEYFDAIIDFLSEFHSIKKVEVMERAEDYMIVNVVTSSNKTISKKIYDCNCFIIAPIEFDGPNEIWTIGSAKREHIQKLYKQLATVGETNLILLKEVDFGMSELTKQQKNVLENAISKGYYEWPRKITATKLAKKLNLSKTTFLEHLRKAEAKIITDYGRYK